MLQIIINRRPASILVDDAMPTIGPGTRVIVNTLCYGQQVGTIVRISESPYYGEKGIQRAFVVGDGWSDYILEDELIIEAESATCCDCGKEHAESMMCPECGYCLGCCDCPTDSIDELIEIEDDGSDYAYDDWKDTRALHRWAHG